MLNSPIVSDFFFPIIGALPGLDDERRFPIINFRFAKKLVAIQDYILGLCRPAWIYIRGLI